MHVCLSGGLLLTPLVIPYHKLIFYSIKLYISLYISSMEKCHLQMVVLNENISTQGVAAEGASLCVEISSYKIMRRMCRNVQLPPTPGKVSKKQDRAILQK